MTAPAGTGLTRVTVATPHRRLDIALPDHILVADLLPHLLAHAGEQSVNLGEADGGWTLRRTTGAELDGDSDLAGQQVRDGELLHLVPSRLNWPEPAYDDMVEVIAGAARKTGGSWGPGPTRRFGLTAVGAVLTLGAVLLVASGSPWRPAGLIALAVAATLTGAGVLLARAAADAGAGAVVAGYALLYAAVGGALVTMPAHARPGHIGAPQLIAGSAVLVLVGVLSIVGVAATARVFTAGIGIGAAGLVAGLVCLAGASSWSAAAVVLTVAVGLQPAYPLLASSLGGVPLPVLPQRAEAILEDQPLPDRGSVFAAVARANELLIGALVASAAVAAAAGIVLIDRGGTVAPALALVGAVALALRARLFPSAPQRVPLLASALVTVGYAAYAWARHAHGGGGRLVVPVALLGLAAVILAATLFYGRRTPSPYLGRIADALDVLTVMALVPLACGVLGVFHTVQDMFSSVG